MADHYRKRIRDALVAALTGLATTGARVHASRIWPAERGGLPCLLVYGLRERSQPDGLGDALERWAEFDVVALAEATADLDAALDLMAKEVETAIGRSTLGGLAKEVFLGQSEIRFDAQAAKPVGALAMTWRVLYRTRETDPTVGL